MLFFFLFYVFLFLNFFLLLLLLLLLKRTNFSNRFQFLFHRIKNLSRSTKSPFLINLLWFGLRFTPLLLFNVWLNLIIISYSYLKHAVLNCSLPFPASPLLLSDAYHQRIQPAKKKLQMPIFINTLITFLYFPLYPSLVFTHLSRCI